MKPYMFIAAACCLMAVSCAVSDGNLTDSERALIRDAASRTALDDNGASAGSYPAGTMRVLTVNDEDDLEILRTVSRDFSDEALSDEDIVTLASLMAATVTHPSQDGVGIAAPQVGLNRRMVAVQRFDMEGEPFKVYPNIRLVWASDSTQVGPEGCLSVPDCRGYVSRSTEIVIEYSDIRSIVKDRNTASLFASEDDALLRLEKVPYMAGAVRDSENGRHSGKLGGNGCCEGCNAQGIKTVRDTVRGFTAVIFQHEIDHLEGVLYTDKVQE